MNIKLYRGVALAVITTVLSVTSGNARGPKISSVGASPLAIGEAGVAWFTTWDTALAEAERSNRPIFFMAAAAQCSGISGTF